MSDDVVTAFREESDALNALVADLDEATLLTRTQFKDWTVADVLGHLYIWNDAAALTLTDGDAFTAFFSNVVAAMHEPGGLRAFERGLLAEKSATSILDAWQQSVAATAKVYANADPKTRVRWGGPDMSARSCISARLMETWAHGQAVFDSFGVARTDTDRIYSIAVLGVNTFGFNHTVNGLDVPDVVPRVTLAAPSGAQWDLGDPASDASITGSATEFCQVVTQTRNIADTDLVVTGDTAEHWMRIAQCFAGPPTPPPAAGTRFLQDPGA
ncbi:MAG: TIGR03084 family metal-binding protein [Pseudomonadota bacterium]